MNYASCSGTKLIAVPCRHHLIRFTHTCTRIPIKSAAMPLESVQTPAIVPQTFYSSTDTMQPSYFANDQSFNFINTMGTLSVCVNKTLNIIMIRSDSWIKSTHFKMCQQAFSVGLGLTWSMEHNVLQFSLCTFFRND